MKRTKTDALVIGSGVGGLCLAARLVHRGLKVVVAEKLPYLGGRFSSRKYQGYEISTGAMMVPYGEASAYQEAFDLVGASMRIREAKGGFRFRLKHGDFDTPIDGVDLSAMLGFAMRDDAEANKLGGQFMRSVLWSLPEDTISMREWLAQYTDNQEVQNLYQGFCGAFTGINSHEVSAAEVFSLMKAMGVGLRYGIAINGNVDLMNALGDGIGAKGGEVRTGTACKGIMVDQDRVTGALVETEGTEEIIEADFVISNAGPSMTVQLAGESYFEKSYLKRLRDFGMTTPVVHVCIASREPLCDFDGIINFGNTRRLVFFETPTITCPELAPPDMHFATTYSVPQYTAGPLKLKETIEMIMLDLSDNFPSFKDAELLMVATHHGEWPAMRRWPGYPMPVKTPVQNLFNVGDGCMPKGTVGIEACALSAREVAQEVAG